MEISPVIPQIQPEIPISENIPDSYAVVVNTDQNQPVKDKNTDDGLDNKTINAIINGLQQASASQSTGFPSRDVQKSTEAFSTDPYQQPMFIPPVADIKKNYIHEEQRRVSEEARYRSALPPIVIPNPKVVKEEDVFTRFFDEFHSSIVLFLMFVLFQVPKLNHLIVELFPALATADSHLNIKGTVFMGLLFTTLCYAYSKYVMPLI
jgi:hypothetical protein